VPVLIHLDGVVFHPLARNRHALFVCVFEDVLTILMVNRIQYVEEVFAIAILSLRERVGHELHELRILTNFWPEICHGQLIVCRNVHSRDFVHIQKLFLASKHQFQKVFAYHRVRRHVKLD
jgi:hypothetical protein